MLGELVSIGTLFAFVIVSIGVIVLRRTRPDLERPFRTPFVPALPIASAVVSLGADDGLPRVTWERLIDLDGDRRGDLLRVRSDTQSYELDGTSRTVGTAGTWL